MVESGRRLKHERSDDLWRRAQRVIPAGTQTFGKSPKQWGLNVVPSFLQRAAGSHVWDVDGNEYVDYGMALGPIILGYNYPRVSEAISNQLRDGSIFSLNHPLEVELSELLVQVIPCAEMVRFGKNGSDGTSAAVRLARAHTGRDQILCSGYHGWADWYIGSTSRNSGVPKAVRELTSQFRFNDLESLHQLFTRHKDSVAAVIMEASNFEPPQPGYLAEVKELTQKNGAVLIFDEVLTGFRMALGGAQAYFGVTPDLAIFAKAMANGMPISALVGKAEIMSRFNDVFYSFTFAGETLSMAAAVATIRELQETDALAQIWARGADLKRGCQELIAEYNLAGTIECSGYDCWPCLTFSGKDSRQAAAVQTLFRQEICKRGVLLRPSIFLCYAHTAQDIEATLRAFGDAMSVVSTALRGGTIEQRLEAPIIEPVIRGQVRVSG